jgi:hypothetical protein
VSELVGILLFDGKIQLTYSVGFLLNSNDVSTEAKESPFLRAVIKQWLMKTLQAGEE